MLVVLIALFLQFATPSNITTACNTTNDSLGCHR